MSNLAQYEAIENQGFVGWLCRRCPVVHIDAAMGANGQATPKGVTLADLVESATEHETEVHR